MSRMSFPDVPIPKSAALALSQFREMDYYAVEHYALPIELMMENAGLQLARLVAHTTKDKQARILIGVGNGNNGGGGLVAARRLAAWGYPVYLHMPQEVTKALPLRQLVRAQRFGAQVTELEAPDIWVDAYLGFSQRLPLPDFLLDPLAKANASRAQRISLDIPTGFLGDLDTPHFAAHQVLSLAAAKRILYNLPPDTAIFLADLGIPKAVYDAFGVNMPPFQHHGILRQRTAS